MRELYAAATILACCVLHCEILCGLTPPDDGADPGWPED